MKKVIISVSCLITVISLVFISGCSIKKGTDIEQNNKKLVYTSFYTMYDFTNKIGGDRIILKNLVPSGTEPHDWEPTPSDIAGIEKADVLIYNGAGMEGWIDKVLKAINNKNLISVETSKGINLLKSDHEESLEYDPHVWLNPLYAKQQMLAIKNVLVNADPSNKDYYEKNYTDNANKIDGLDKEYKNAVAQFTRKDIVVAHQAFGYLCNAYGLSQIAIEGVNPDVEPTPSRMAEISKYAKENNVKYIFFEELISPKIAQAIAREVGAKTEVLNPLEGLNEDDIRAGKEYFSVMRDNLEKLSKALK